VAAGIEAAENTFGGVVIAHYIIPNPDENIVEVMPIEYTQKVERFRTF
jgi:microcompartment protein CcmL/EutN